MRDEIAGSNGPRARLERSPGPENIIDEVLLLCK
jgi:hypothetical protein